MFGLFKPVSNQWLPGDERLYTLRLSNVAEPLEPTLLWEARHGGGQGITAEVVKDAKVDPLGKRLRDALDAHCGIVNVPDKRGWLTDERKVFGDLVVWVPPSRWHRDVQIGGPGIERLADNLERLVARDFGPDLLPENGPSCVVMPGLGITQPDVVVIQFGLGVYVPREGESPVGKVAVRTPASTVWATPDDWIFLKSKRAVKRPATLYAGQQYILLGPGAALRPPEAEPQRPVWFTQGQGHILLTLAAEGAIGAYGDDEHVENGREIPSGPDDRAKIYCFAARGSGGKSPNAPEEILVRITRRPDEEQPNDGAIRPPAAGRTGRTILPPGRAASPLGQARTILPGRMAPRLVLVGIALPRIDTPETRIAGLEKYVLWIDEAGRVITDSLNAGEKKRMAAFGAGADRPALFYKPPGASDSSPVKRLPFQPGEVPVELAVSPLPDSHHAILLLGNPPFFGLQDGLRRIGRAVEPPDVRLTFPMNPDSLVWSEGYEQPGSLIDIGLSREHAVLNVKAGNVTAAMSRGSLPVQILQPRRADDAAPSEDGADTGDGAGSGSPATEAAAPWRIKYTLIPGGTEEIPLVPGEGMIIGGYVLQLQIGP